MNFLRFAVFGFVLITVLVSGSCRTKLKFGYKNLKAGNWVDDTAHVAFNNLPEEVMKAYENFYTVSIEEDTSHNKIFQRSEGFVYYTQNDVDSLCRFVNFSSDYSIENRWGPFGLYFTIDNKKYMIHYDEKSSPLILHGSTLYYPTNFYVDEESKVKFQYKNFTGYAHKYYVAHYLPWLNKKFNRTKAE